MKRYLCDGCHDFVSETGWCSYCNTYTRVEEKNKDKYISKHDHDLIIKQVMELGKKENKFPETDTYLTMRDKNQKLKAALDVAVEALESCSEDLFDIIYSSNESQSKNVIHGRQNAKEALQKIDRLLKGMGGLDEL